MPRLRYLLFYKPFRVLSQFTPNRHDGVVSSQQTLSDFIPVADVYPVGRLDYDSEGLLLLTNDGTLQHKLADPRFGHQRTYWCQVEGVVTAEACRQLSEGTVIQGQRTKPCTAEMISEPLLPPRDPPVRYRANIPTSWLQISLTEGRNRQVRHMTAAVGFPTLRLVRIALETLSLGDLAPGQWRDLCAKEVQHLRHQVSNKKRGPHRNRVSMKSDLSTDQ